MRITQLYANFRLWACFHQFNFNSIKFSSYYISLREYPLNLCVYCFKGDKGGGKIVQEWRRVGSKSIVLDIESGRKYKTTKFLDAFQSDEKYSVEIATSYRLDDPGSIFRYFQFSLLLPYVLMFLSFCIFYISFCTSCITFCTSCITFCIFCITYVHSVFNSVLILY
jgi:hypothetical protein